METWKHLRAILLLPVTATMVIPVIILWLAGTDTLGLWQSAPATRVVLPVFGGTLVCVGLVLLATIRLFMTVGKGTSPRGTRRSGWWSGASTATSATR